MNFIRGLGQKISENFSKLGDKSSNAYKLGKKGLDIGLKVGSAVRDVVKDPIVQGALEFLPQPLYKTAKLAEKGLDFGLEAGKKLQGTLERGENIYDTMKKVQKSIELPKQVIKPAIVTENDPRIPNKIQGSSGPMDFPKLTPEQQAIVF
jgi:hypothetical protein